MILAQFLKSLEHNCSKKPESLWPLRYYLGKNSPDNQSPPHFKDAYAKVLAYSIFMAEQEKKLSLLLDSINASHLLFKGLDIESRFYPGPGTRPQSDIDLLVDPAAMPQIHTLLVENGFAFNWSGNYHHVYKKDSISFEIHTAFCSYKYLLYFDLLNLNYLDLFQTKSLSPELYLLCCAIQFYDENASRPIPLVDMYQIISSGIDLHAWTELVKNRSAGFPVYFAHFWMEEHLGYSPWTEELLAPLGWDNAKKNIAAMVVKTQNIKEKDFWTLFRMADNKPMKLLRTFFPPKEVYAGHVGAGRFPLLAHILKTARRLL
ncbi:MAG: hypothetical protein A2268_02660 [Candidatus Raymondbacteria bacterium RifOxyA12_full_50_37]|uniref:Nucleotidyltransferase n=1 Tax=Candidatus Raymondbacteria bacterium RIFOXYD12_FULL_49_13 TaxID=1817890 RepID=A0A1F7F5M0_UNCRA|nr:MAG: hypothetical protein A2268_02660 [Candidatus Raymondbacteria bacterium RifOxyA12_full_50_37]OGJ89170.1 MAG: hypothetical protein A2248_11480 [Candidatus Raymondbacteria bacterium RIFOXYA2_FULL_49_16]OGJ96652.1 MAG: hypothetical protein A2453_06595 [Candidatus Raymondbacteria bacterium RIFOXYC2_FULL_50_21]OGK00010.1 MAG: hypothetical protein A2350_21045 [Candidatus Raymondbacteria bacterium RifOxyB12_full_50_8]OGK01964.1 MAG: hypothetical protein A2519_17700 [Candidatus Raymondbacteria b